METTLSAAELAEIIREREDLVLRIRSERVWWEQLAEMGTPNFGQMASRLQDFRDRVAAHFRREEAAELVCAREQEQSSDFRRINGEHASLLARLDDVFKRLNQCDGYDCWGEAGNAFQALAEEIQRQEEVELNRLRSLVPTESSR
jgi:hypothetical protein